MKVFRKITPGTNPDIAVHEVLTRAGSDHVAALYGWLETTAPDDVAGEEDHLHLAMLQQFLRTASDGWDLALVSVRNLFTEADLHADEVGGDFAGEAARLGIALAETHETLRRALPHRPCCTPDAVTELVDGMHRRLDDALEVVPGLEEHADRLRTTFDHVRRMRDVPGPADPRRPAPRPDAAHRAGLEDRRLRGRAGQAAGRAAAARLPLARRRRDAPLVRLRAPGRRAHRVRARHRRATSSASTARPSGRRATATPSSRRTPASRSRSTRRRCWRRTSPTRPSTRPSTRPATARRGCPSRWPPSPGSIRCLGIEEP